MSSWSPSLPVINAGNFGQAAESDFGVVILIWATWDPVSRSLDGRLGKAHEDYASLRFCAMDLDQEQNWPLAENWGIMTTPTLVCLLNGLFHELLVGLRPEPQIRETLSGWDVLAHDKAHLC